MRSTLRHDEEKAMAPAAGVAYHSLRSARVRWKATAGQSLVGPPAIVVFDVGGGLECPARPRTNVPAPLEHLLVAIDFSVGAANAIARAGRLPLAERGKVTVVHVLSVRIPKEIGSKLADRQHSLNIKTKDCFCAGVNPCHCWWYGLSCSGIFL